MYHLSMYHLSMYPCVIYPCIQPCNIYPCTHASCIHVVPCIICKLVWTILGEKTKIPLESIILIELELMWIVIPHNAPAHLKDVMIPILTMSLWCHLVQAYRLEWMLIVYCIDIQYRLTQKNVSRRSQVHCIHLGSQLLHLETQLNHLGSWNRTFLLGCIWDPNLTFPKHISSWDPNYFILNPN